MIYGRISRHLYENSLQMLNLSIAYTSLETIALRQLRLIILFRERTMLVYLNKLRREPVPTADARNVASLGFLMMPSRDPNQRVREKRS